MRFIFLLFSLSALCLSVSAQEQLRWALVEDVPADARVVLADNLNFLLAETTDDCFTVVCKDGTMLPNMAAARFSQIDPVGVPAVKGETTVYELKEGRLRLSCLPEGVTVTVFDAAGKMVGSCRECCGAAEINLSCCPAGVYLLKANGVTLKLMKR